MKKLFANQLSSLLLQMNMPVYAPVQSGELVLFDRFAEGMTLRLDAVKSDKSPKDILFPQWETLMHARLDGKSIEVTPQELCQQDYVLFGARACDIRAFAVLDKVFLAEPVDEFYAARRAHGTIVGLACANPEESCFCNVFGIDPAQPEADVVLWMVGDDYLAKAYTEKGEALLAKWNLPDADASAEKAVEDEKQSIAKKIAAQPFANLSLKGLDGDHLKELFDSPKWKKLSVACLGCGSCTFVCPTCQCYDIRDYDSGHGVQHYRCWDSCMYNDFTLMAHGTPRPTQLQRYRQRFMHKLVYYPANNDGLYSCVGCGRCVKKCPMNLNIVKVIKALGEENQ